MGSKRAFKTARSSPADPSVAASLQGHPSLLYLTHHPCAGVLDPPVHPQQHQPQNVHSERETRLHSGPSRTQKPHRFIGDGQTELRAEALEVSEGSSSGQSWLQGGWAGPAGAVTRPWSGVVTDSSAGGPCCSSLPNAPCGSRASGSARGCFCTAECLKGFWLLGKEHRRSAQESWNPLRAPKPTGEPTGVGG